MTIFGMGFRIALIAVAVLLERIGSFVRSMPLGALAHHPAVQRLLASWPDGLEEHLRGEHDHF